MMTEKSNVQANIDVTAVTAVKRAGRAAGMQAARLNARFGSMTRRSRLRKIRRYLQKSGFELHPKLWNMACRHCGSFRARFIWTIERSEPILKARGAEQGLSG